MRIYSSGGLGDALIVAAKIHKLYKHQEVSWMHYEKHPIQHIPITQLQEACRQFLDLESVGCIIDPKPELQAKIDMEIWSNHNESTERQYLTTVVHENDCEDGLKIPQLGEQWDPHSGYKKIVVHKTAGRITDNSKRGVSDSVILKTMNIALETCPKPDHVIELSTTGPEPWKNNEIGNQLDYYFSNYCGHTNSILEVFEEINECDLFIGSDGVAAYYAALIGKPTIIHFHLPNLPGHYFHPQWHNVCAIVDGRNNLEGLPLFAQEFIIEALKE